MMPPWIDIKVTPGNLITIATVGLTVIATLAVRAHDIDTLLEHDKIHGREIQSIRGELIAKEQRDKTTKETLGRVEEKIDFLTNLLITRSQKP